MKLIVTGASGFVGRALLARLSESGHGGFATGRKPPANVPAGWHAIGRGDVLSGVVDAADVDAIIHLEVKHHAPRPSPEDIQAFHAVNVAGTREWLHWAERHRVQRFILASSIKAVPPGDRSERVAEAAGVAGARQSEPDTPYGKTKALAEAALREWAAEDAGRIAVILRSAPVYGPGNEANFADFVRQVIAGRPCLIGAGDAEKSVVSRSNVVAAIEFVMMSGTPGCEVFNLSDRETFSLAQLVDMIASLANAPKPRRIPRPVAGIVASFGDLLTAVTGRGFPLTTDRMRQILATSVFPSNKLMAAGFRHPQTTRQGLADMLEWMAREGVISRREAASIGPGVAQECRE